MGYDNEKSAWNRISSRASTLTITSTTTNVLESCYNRACLLRNVWQLVEITHTMTAVASTVFIITGSLSLPAYTHPQLPL